MRRIEEEVPRELRRVTAAVYSALRVGATSGEIQEAINIGVAEAREHNTATSDAAAMIEQWARDQSSSQSSV